MKKLKPHKVDWGQIDRFLASADKKLASAHKILAFDEEACLQQAYEAMLKASLGFMFTGFVSYHDAEQALRTAQSYIFSYHPCRHRHAEAVNAYRKSGLSTNY